MAEVSIGLGIVLSLVLSETLGVTAGGIIVPGYVSLFLHQPSQVLATFLVAVLVWFIIQVLGKFIFLYGKRRIVLALILGFFFGYISRNLIFIQADLGSVAVIGNIIPGLMEFSFIDRKILLVVEDEKKHFKMIKKNNTHKLRKVDDKFFKNIRAIQH